MIGAIIEWSIRNRLLVLLLLAGLLAVSFWATTVIDLDAIPDLSDVQVIIRTDYPGQSPKNVEDQITYPLTTALLGLPKTRDVRGFSMVGASFVYVIFDDGTDIYWARSRVIEQLSVIKSSLPNSVTPELGPDATGVGWIYQYVLQTGKYCPDHTEGLWHDPEIDNWFAENVNHRKLVHHRTFDESMNTCPLDGKILQHADVDLADLRSLQDWYIRYELNSVDGVSEVAAVGGFVRQYQITLDPIKLRAFGLSIQKIRQKIIEANTDVGGRMIEMGEMEYLVQGRGLLGTFEVDEKSRNSSAYQTKQQLVMQQLREVAISTNQDGTPLLLQDIADVSVGPEIRRGIAEWNGEGETVAGIVVMRFGENAYTTIEAVKDKIADIQKSLPPGVEIISGYDRSDLISRAVNTLSSTLLDEMLIVTLVCILFLIHVRSALVAAIVIPAGVGGSILIMHLLGINANIMSLGGIAIAIGVMVDSSIIMVENAHEHLVRYRKRKAGEPKKTHLQIILESAREVGPTLFFSLMIITLSFLPVFALEEQSGRLFKPLAFTKTFAMAIASFLAITVIPALMYYFVRKQVILNKATLKKKVIAYISIILIPAIVTAVIPLSLLEHLRWWLAGGWIVLSSIIILPQKIFSEEKNPLSRLLVSIYNPFFTWSINHRWIIIVGSVIVVLITILPFSELGNEFMPPLEEGDFLYMPNSDPGISITKAKELLQQTDKLIKQFPEVVTVMGKIGRSETATDPAPLTMIETTIILERDKSKWRQLPTSGFLGLFPGKRPITLKELVDGYELPNGQRIEGINDALNIPGLTGALTSGSMPIKTRIDMLATGIRTAIGIKVMGDNLDQITQTSREIEHLLKTSKELSAFTKSAYSDKLTDGNYIDIIVDRKAISRLDMTVKDVLSVIETVLGGKSISYTIEGRERYPINLRYPRELRESPEDLKNLIITTPSGFQIPLQQVADIRLTTGPPMIKSENARLTSWIFIEVQNIDIGSYVDIATELIQKNIQFAPGVTYVWSGQWEYMQKANATLTLVTPLVLGAIIILLYLNTKSWFRTILILLTLSFSVVGAIWTLYFLDYNLSVAVWVGIIALLGLDAETSQVMILYLDNSVARCRKEGKLSTVADIWHAIHEGAVKRIRPKTMMVVTSFSALLPLMFAEGAGADTMRRLAAPMIGGLITSYILELLIYPVIMFVYYKRRI